MISKFISRLKEDIDFREEIAYHQIIPSTNKTAIQRYQSFPSAIDCVWPERYGDQASLYLWMRR